MLDGLRSEFPALTRLRLPGRPAIAAESPWWAFLSGAGAAFIVSGVTLIASLPALPVLFPQTEPRPVWLTPSAIGEALAALAAGAVLLRAGGPLALALYAGFEVLRMVAALPGRLLFCERAGAPGQTSLPYAVSCDLPSMIASEWPLWFALLAGALLARASFSAALGANRTLRGAGAYSLVATAFAALIGVAAGSAGADDQLALTHLFTLAQIVAGAVAGIVLARATAAGTMLVALLVLAVPLSFALPNALRTQVGDEPPDLALMRWAAVYMPVAAALAIVAARGYARRRRGGTFF